MDLELTSDAAVELQELPAVIQSRIASVLGRLRNWPAVSGVKPLRHGLAGRFRIRTGDYRVQFHLRGKVLVVEKVGHRDGFYED